MQIEKTAYKMDPISTKRKRSKPFMALFWHQENNGSLGVGDFWWRKQGSRSPGHQEWSKEKDGRMESHTKGTVSHSTCVWGCGKAV
jgi:hypothetical protein